MSLSGQSLKRRKGNRAKKIFLKKRNEMEKKKKEERKRVKEIEKYERFFWQMRQQKRE